MLCGAAFVSGLTSDGAEGIEPELPLHIAVDTAIVVISPLRTYLGLWSAIGGRKPLAIRYVEPRRV
jgi:hypothetical protein